MLRDAVRDRARDVVLAHDADFAVLRLHAAAVAAAVIDQIEPRGLRAGRLRVIEHVIDERREIFARRHIVRRRDFDVAGHVAVGDRIRLRA